MIFLWISSLHSLTVMLFEFIFAIFSFLATLSAPKMAFSTLFVTPAEAHRALSSSDTPQNGRIVPVAVGKVSALESFQSRHVPGSM